MSLTFIIKRIARPPARIVRQILRRISVRTSAAYMEWKVAFCFVVRSAGKPHGLPQSLVVSLTSYPARFDQLTLTLKCLLTQTMAADRVILWVAYQDKSYLTPVILGLQKFGLEIAYCDDIRSFKKIIPALLKYPGNFIVTADDDLYYWPTWLEELVQNYQGNQKEIVCHRAHLIRMGKNNLPLPYSQWEFETKNNLPSPLNFPTSGGGTLYPPKCLHPDVLKSDLFLKYCPDADDIWLYWMMRLNGTVARIVPLAHHIYTWPDTQQTALWHINCAQGGNDAQIKNMIDQYGNIFLGG